MNPITVLNSPLALFILKALGALLISTATVGAVKALIWLKEVKTNHLPHIQAAAEEARDAARAIPAAIERQTTALVTELREQRADIRSLTLRL